MTLSHNRSGNTLISYYLNDILDGVGITDDVMKMKINIGNIAWNLVNAAALAIIAMKFPRRRMYLICTCSLICVYIGWTISSARYAIAGDLAVGKLSIFFIYLYSPCYNIGYNALTYSMSLLHLMLRVMADDSQQRTLPSSCRILFDLAESPSSSSSAAAPRS